MLGRYGHLFVGCRLSTPLPPMGGSTSEPTVLRRCFLAVMCAAETLQIGVLQPSATLPDRDDVIDLDGPRHDALLPAVTAVGFELEVLITNLAPVGSVAPCGRRPTLLLVSPGVFRAEPRTRQSRAPGLAAGGE